MVTTQLLIDVGNGRTKFGLANDELLLEQRDLPTSQINDKTLERLLRNWSWQRVVVSSVVPLATQQLSAYFGSDTIVIRHDLELGIGIRYPQPASIGADRLVNAVSLAKRYGTPGIVIDFGTAVTFDVISADAFYTGGVIAPGLRLMTDYLYERTALLPMVDLREPNSAIGQSTEQAILSGAAIGYRGMIRGILKAIEQELAPVHALKIIATGGDAAWIASQMSEIHAVDADLTLHGLRLVGNLHGHS